jgi:uncharacterized YigZ family protein
MPSLFTLKAPAEPVEYRIRGSRFIAQILPVETRAAVDSVLRLARREYPDATHLCYAYRLVSIRNVPIDYATDAGEPRGSAGIPILNVLKKNSLVDILVWVARYFGGTKLGIPRLIEAYGETTRLSLQNVRLVPWVPCTTFKVWLPYAVIDRVKSLVQRVGGKVLAETYDQHVELTLQVPTECDDEVIQNVNNWAGNDPCYHLRRVERGV